MRTLKVTGEMEEIEITDPHDSKPENPEYYVNPDMTVNKTPSTATAAPGKRNTEVKSRWL